MGGSLQYIPFSRWCEITGDSKGALSNRLRGGRWLSGVHTVRPKGSRVLWVDLEAAAEWLSEEWS